MKVLITRAKEQSKEFANQLITLHHEPIFFPTIEIAEPNSWDETDNAIRQIENYTDLIFTSTNGVEFFFKRFEKYFPLQKLSGKTFHVVGNKTQEIISNYGFAVSTLPEKFDSKELAKKIITESNGIDKNFLFPHGNLTDSTIENTFGENNMRLDSIIVYQTVKTTVNESMKKEIQFQFLHNLIGIITFFSPSSVKYFLEEFPTTIHNTKITIAVIGETTKRACVKNGFSSNQIQFIENIFQQSLNSIQ
ncbi:MAG: uroporphyrinogen-III synthase [Ignavibacteria bacterium]|nr:uroporphyrinogen-III synthase [Ignavibacteria bacterium]